MEAKELRIGNLLQYSGIKVYVLGIHQAPLGKYHTLDLGYYTDSAGFERHENDDQLSGIPLTPEWLERFGFHHNSDLGLWNNGNDFDLERTITGNRWDVYISAKEISTLDYVHDLQNLYHAIFKSELQLKQ